MKRLLFLFFIYTLSSCQSGGFAHVPAGIIVPDSMVTVLTDVHIFQATLQLGYIREDSARLVAKAFDDVLKKHHLTEDEYSKSIKYYSYHTSLLDGIYEKVLSNISQQKAELLGKKHS